MASEKMATATLKVCDVKRNKDLDETAFYLNRNGYWFNCSLLCEYQFKSYW